MRRTLLFIAIGAVLEVVVFLSAMPKNSTQPITPWQTVMGYTQVPGGLVFGLFGMAGFGHALDRTPEPLRAIGIGLMFGIPFLTQAAVFAVPVWVFTRGRGREAASLVRDTIRMANVLSNGKSR